MCGNLEAGGYARSHILNALLSSEHVTVSVLSRHTSNSTFPSDVIVPKTDYTEPSLLEIFKGKDAVVSALGGSGLGEQRKMAVVSALGGSGLGEQRKMADAAEKAGVKRFLPCEYGCNTRNEGALQLVPLWQRKRDLIRYLEKKAGEIADFSWTALMTETFFDGALKTGFLGFNLSSKTTNIFDSGDTAFSTTNLDTVGEAVVSILEHQPHTANKYIFINSFTTTQNKIRSALERFTDTKSKVNHVTSEDQIKLRREKMVKGDFSGLHPLILSTSVGQKYGSNFPIDETLSNGLLELPDEGMEDMVRVIAMESSIGEAAGRV